MHDKVHLHEWLVSRIEYLYYSSSARYWTDKAMWRSRKPCRYEGKEKWCFLQM